MVPSFSLINERDQKILLAPYFAFVAPPVIVRSDIGLFARPEIGFEILI
jgi:hypothetical protein